MENKTNAKEKITLPKNLQREMMNFFLQASMSNNATAKTGEALDKENQQTPEIQKEGCWLNW